MLYQRHTDWSSRIIPILTLGLYVLPLSPVYSQAVDATTTGNDTGSDQLEAEETTRAMEQIIVTGQRPIRDLIREGEQLTEDFYMRLNEVIDNEDFEVTCENERRVASSIRVRVCRTGFQRRLDRYEAASTFQEIRDTQTQAATGDMLAESLRPETTEITGNLGNMGSEMLSQRIGEIESQAAARESTRGSVGAESAEISGPLAAEAIRWQAEFQQAILVAVNTDPVLNQQFHRLLELKSRIEDYRSPREQQAEQESGSSIQDARPSFRRTPR